MLLVAGHFLLGAFSGFRHTIKNFYETKPNSKPISGDIRENLPVYDDHLNNSEFWKEHIQSWTTTLLNRIITGVEVDSMVMRMYPMVELGIP